MFLLIDVLVLLGSSGWRNQLCSLLGSSTRICSIPLQIGTALTFPLESPVCLIVPTLFSSMDTARYSPLLVGS